MEYTELYEDELDETQEVSETEDTNYEASDNQPTFSELLADPELFDRFTRGDYTYETNDYVKHAYGQLELAQGTRNPYAQRKVGGGGVWDGGHEIANRFGGASGVENLDAQHRDVNRRDYKQLENEWAEALEEGDKVYLDVHTYHSNGSQRPNTWMGCTIREHEGTRDWDAFSFCNTSIEEQAEWERIIEEEDY